MARSSRARIASSRSSSSLRSLSLAASFFWMCARFSTSSRALRSAMYSDSDSLAKLSEICTSCSPRPSAASRLSSGMVYPLMFFQFEMHGGI